MHFDSADAVMTFAHRKEIMMIYHTLLYGNSTCSVHMTLIHSASIVFSVKGKLKLIVQFCNTLHGKKVIITPDQCSGGSYGVITKV